MQSSLSFIGRSRPWVSFYCLALFNEIEDKMNEKAIVYSALSIRSVPTRIPAPQKAPFYLSELMAESLSLIPHEGIEVEVSIEPEDTMLYADRALTSQVMVNLLENATEALLAQTCERKITIRSTIDAEERIQIEITNNEKAIPQEVAENIFTPFFTTKTDGSGIGPAVSRQIIRLHGGSLRLKHNEEGRVAFAVVLE